MTFNEWYSDYLTSDASLTNDLSMAPRQDAEAAWNYKQQRIEELEGVLREIYFLADTVPGASECGWNKKLILDKCREALGENN